MFFNTILNTSKAKEEVSFKELDHVSTFIHALNEYNQGFAITLFQGSKHCFVKMKKIFQPETSPQLLMGTYWYGLLLVYTKEHLKQWNEYLSVSLVSRENERLLALSLYVWKMKLS